MWAIELWDNDRWVEVDEARKFVLAEEIVREYRREGKQARWRLKSRR